MVRKFDFLVIGSGIAGMSFALKVAHKGKVALICKAGLEEANTYFAQGGISSVTNLKVDNFEKHIEDTMIAGDWISDRAAVEKVVREAPSQIQELIKWGVEFDKKENGEFDLHKEGGHSEFRILHHKDNTGAEIQTSLIKTVKAHPNITVFTDHYAVEIITQHHLGIIVTRHTPGIKCFGAYVLNESTGEVDTFLSKVTIMATGGCEAVYRNTTNPLVATGDGMRKQFTEKFEEIRKEFDRVFRQLFGGGKGTLELEEDTDVLEAGIRIISQPPGKKLQNMMQLSGGEKALTAIALLFAIQNLKPSPFCLLDEIEAALDDSNVTRFAQYLHKLTKNTQFIVITHRRGTMTAADRLYGITMQEKGVSTLVSVDLIEGELDK